ncbi:MAG: aminotransferase class V-fold PLP-dependent enzyme [Calditrichaeota bacterium]|nr:MAG: aminotransferase class V-fold PLP-dependent enzyme [Calditrichota bacterium]MBL1207917.1 aminotransferase class V-fold PLP-dependent enzyme [Calditrichota bacterium]NOG47752.1 aminotransferase class V-fold PLP-dependent enzyme [Calditrichota bacterium]
MLNNDDFRKHAHQVVDWIADYLQDVEKYPVKSPAKPKEIYNQLPDLAPENGEPFDVIMKDFQNIIVPGITHWQSPNFFAYFPANSSYPSVLAEMITAALGTQAMIWETSPSAAELEERVMNWLKEMIGIPQNFDGVIQDTASTATLASILTAREKISNYKINSHGLNACGDFRVYCSTETHSSIEKAVKIAGIGKQNLVKIEVDDKLSLKPDILSAAIEKDIAEGKKPLCVIASIGTTSTTSIDPIKSIAEICKKHELWLHVDAAFAGSALVLPEFRWMIEGIEMADSFVFNPHKWMFTNFDCSAYFVKDKESLIRTFEILPEYLKTRTRGKVNDYRDWGVPLGRRFRALKLWFVIRNFGVKGIQEKIRLHISLAKKYSEKINNHAEFEVLAPVTLNTICFRYKPDNINDEDTLNDLNEKLLHKLNDSGKLYLTHTKVKDNYSLRLSIGQTNVEQKHVEQAWQLIQNTSLELLHSR